MEPKEYPKKYWWLVLLVLPAVLALIPILPALLKKDDKTGDGGTNISQSGKGNIQQTGSGIVQIGGVNILNSDLSSKMYVTDVSIIASEYEKALGHPLIDENFKGNIERALAGAEAGRHTESIRLLEELSKSVPLPALYTNLGVEYAKVGDTDAAMKAFSRAINEDPSYEPAHLNRGIVELSTDDPQEALSDFEKASSMQQTKQLLEVVRPQLEKESQGDATKISSSASSTPPFVVFAADATGPPAATLLEAGDLIWPKRPATIVPYNSRGEADTSDALRWRKEKEAYLDQLRRNPNPSPQERERYVALQNMTYEEFAGYYLGDYITGQPAAYGLVGTEVSHVGIIEITNGRPFVVEAMLGPGVQRLSYADWLQKHPGELFWVGRLKEVSPEKRATVAKKAAEQIGKPYNFWDFDLEDANGFYCSKLAWLSVLQGAGFPPDDDVNPNRLLWYSPKQLMKSKHIELIANPR
jgi:hypothetical protein